ncbi:hypothetical protein KVR01_003736 [Diaporthe batatas]|uniref:uncharacterized protein n=1 Tax=Diaporthe batatas TaxID=748121 RepID=UPI001D04D641|nr:uncharacterized protein KVR01_003736 [Diaporthe batatas]KAG8168047.1 hypothetical protein KVR01_003736 [Diaporthe batatas]
MANNQEAPKPQAPMEARPTSSSGTDASRGTTGPITQAPKAEPRPVAQKQEPELRGGGMTIGFNCCRGHCNCHETCC